MSHSLIIALTSVLLLLSSLGGHAGAESADMTYDDCVPGFDNSACIPPDPV